ncbi:MAG: hypothetical protein IPI39_27220 [Candidatus Obscuribacter sp.]|nr:hypothetical protein [Candidatus Obscuribacter sp.]
MIAAELNRDNYIFSTRDLPLLCKSKFATAENYVVLASTYLSVIGDEEKEKPVNRYLDKALSIAPNALERITSSQIGASRKHVLLKH